MKNVLKKIPVLGDCKKLLKKNTILLMLFAVLCAAQVCFGLNGKVYDPRDYGAKTDGKSLCTGSIQKAIDECSAGGGGVVRLAGGRFLTGTIFMKNGVTLEIAESSTLLGSTDLKDYPANICAYRSYTDKYVDKALIWGENLTNIGIRGKGTIDGQGAGFEGDYKLKKRPYLIRFITSRNIIIEDITLRESAMWMQHYLACDNIVMRGVTVWNHCNKNNDMVDIDSCHNVLIENCTGDSDDDGITLKSTSNRACENVTIRNCTVSSHCNAIKCGTESNGGFKNLRIIDCVIKPSASKTKIFGVHKGKTGIALEIVDGGTMDAVVVNNVQIEGTLSPIFIRLGDRGRGFQKDMPRPGVGKMSNIFISDVTASDAGDIGCPVAGITGAIIENLTLKNIRMSFAGGQPKERAVRDFDEKRKKYPGCTMFGSVMPGYGFFFWNVKGLRLENIELTTEKPDGRDAICLENVSLATIDGKPVTASGNYGPTVRVLERPKH